jgi:Carboxypeptidase regulatory-like domain
MRFPCLRMVRLLLSFMTLGISAVAQTVEGTVINSVTGNGIPAIQVEIKAAAGKTRYSTVTDAQGHFLVEGVQTGAYTASSSSPDYSPKGEPGVFQVTAAGTPVKLELRVVPLSRISGRVLRGRSEGVADAQVELTGSERLLDVGTDAAGKFTLRVLPGAYTLSATPPHSLRPPDRGPDDDRVMVWARTYYPGESLPEAASKIMAQPGGETFVELKLQAVPAHAVRGVVLNPGGAPAPDVSVMLSGEAGQPVYHSESQSGGAFRFPAVMDGEWRITAAERGAVKPRAVQWVEIAGHDLEGIKLRLSPPFTVRGQVVMEPLSGMPAPNPPSIYLVPRAERTGWQSWMANWMQRPEMHFVEPLPANAPAGGVTKQNAEILDSLLLLGAISARPESGDKAASGRFSVQNIYAGVYSILPMPPPPLPYYLEAIRVGETDVNGQEVELSSEVPVTVVYKTDGGIVRGMVEKCASGPVLLVPQETSRQRLGFLRAAQCDSNDRYAIGGVRPGEYYVLAFAGDGPMPELTKGLLSQAGRVTVLPGAASLADLRAISREY